MDSSCDAVALDTGLWSLCSVGGPLQRVWIRGLRRVLFSLYGLGMDPTAQFRFSGVSVRQRVVPPAPGYPRLAKLRKNRGLPAQACQLACATDCMPFHEPHYLELPESRFVVARRVQFTTFTLHRAWAIEVCEAVPPSWC